MASAAYCCGVNGCSFVSLTINELLRHYRVVNHEKFRSSCCVHGCNDYFRTFSALKSHIYRVHKQLVIKETSIVTSTDNDDDLDVDRCGFDIEMHSDGVIPDHAETNPFM